MASKGRPTQDKKDKRFEIRLSQDTYDKLEEYAEQMNISKAQVIHKGIELVKAQLEEQNLPHNQEKSGVDERYQDKKGSLCLYAAVIFALLGSIVEPMRMIFTLIAWILAIIGYLKSLLELSSALKQFLKK